MSELFDVYCDLHRRVTSVRALSGPDKGRVVDKPHAIVLADVVLRVNPGGHRKVVATGIRLVHAFARGRRTDLTPSCVLSRPDAIRVRYNPHLRAEFFAAESGQALTHLALLSIEGKAAWGVV